MNIEEYMNAAEIEDVDVLNEPADFYVKPFELQEESDLQKVEEELQKKNILLLNVMALSKRPNTRDSMINTIKEYVQKINGDIAILDREKGIIMLTPTKVKIVKNRKAKQ